MRKIEFRVDSRQYSLALLGTIATNLHEVVVMRFVRVLIFCNLIFGMGLAFGGAFFLAKTTLEGIGYVLLGFGLLWSAILLQPRGPKHKPKKTLPLETTPIEK